MCTTHCINMFPRQDPKIKTFGHVLRWALLPNMILTTFEFSSHKPVHFGSDVVILTTASLFGEHGTGANTTVTHTYCIGHLET